MAINHLEKFFDPETIAVIGASDKPGSVGLTIVQNLEASGFEGRVYPVNKRRPKIMGQKSYASVKKLPSPVDLAVITTPIETVPGIIRECATGGIQAAVIISAGGKEIGPAGYELEQAIKTEAEKGGIRIIGPNCLGVICSKSKLNATFCRYNPYPGHLALISQSGAMCSTILDWAMGQNLGFSHIASIGSMLDVDFGDLIDYLGSDPLVGSILLYMENLSETRKFMSAARAISRIKPIVVLKAGRSEAGARAAGSHTGAMTGKDEVYDEAFKRAGLVRVDTIEELFDCAELLAKQPRPIKPGLAIVTNAGGPGVMAADALGRYGLEPVELSPDTLEQLNAILPPHWSRANPIDMLGEAKPETYGDVVDICLNAKEVNALTVILCPQSITSTRDVAALLVQKLRNRNFPVIMVCIGGPGVDDARDILKKAGFPVYSSPERAVRAFWYLYSYNRNLKMLQEVPRKVRGNLEVDRALVEKVIEGALAKGIFLLDEASAKSLLAAYGVPVNPTRVAADIEQAKALSREIGFPVVLKLLSDHITHKTEADGVCLNVCNETQVEEAFEKIMTGARNHDPDAVIRGVTVQPMVERIQVELILGSSKNRDFGPVLLFGSGGTMVGLLQDKALGLPPLNRLLAARMMESTQIYPLLKGHRGRPGADLVVLEEILMRLSQLITDFPEVAELDINPLAIVDGHPLALDARIAIEPRTTPSPMHLVISPYPNQYEMTTVTKGGQKVFIRPIRPEDAPALTDFHSTLSDRSIYFRFCHPVKKLTPDMLVRFTQVDYDREVALVAFEADSNREQIIAVARTINSLDGLSAELAVVVSDKWHGQGVGACMIERCMTITLERGVKKLYAYILPENTVMRTLMRKLGWRCKDFTHNYFEYPDESQMESTVPLVQG